MKTILLLLVLLSLKLTAQIRPGDRVPDLKFQTLLNAPVKSANLEQLRGKVVLLEFWATWCGSCLEAMPHLKALQARFKNKLSVITVTDETEKRTRQFLDKQPSNLWFVVDTGRVMASVFPHQLIPHSVLIGPDGTLIANTSPEQITPGVIDSLLAGKIVHLQEKKDVTMDHEELISTYFGVKETVGHRFIMIPEIKGGPGLSTAWLTDPVFNGRRLTIINTPISGMYRLAFGDFNYGRMVNNSGEGKNPPLYCLDIIVERPEQLFPQLREELLKRFDLQARVEQQERAVQVLRIADKEKFARLVRNANGKRTYAAGHGFIDQQGLTMADFANFVESYATGKLTIDETGNLEKLDIKFDWQPENRESFKKVLSDMGLALTTEQRKVDILVVYKVL